MRRTTRLLVCVSVLCAVLFIGVALAAKSGALAAFDAGGLWLAHSFASSSLDTIMPLVTNLGEAVYVAIAAVALGAVFAGRRQWGRAVIVVAGVGGAEVLNIVLKQLADRSRPELWAHLVAESSQSFPSGHATASAALALCMVAVAWHTKWRYAAIIAGAVYVFVIAFTRLYAGVHYPSDILAAWLSTAAWVGLVVAGVLAWRMTKVTKKLD